VGWKAVGQTVTTVLSGQHPHRCQCTITGKRRHAVWPTSLYQCSAVLSPACRQQRQHLGATQLACKGLGVAVAAVWLQGSEQCWVSPGYRLCHRVA
jgi:hypothetical protein